LSLVRLDARAVRAGEGAVGGSHPVPRAHSARGRDARGLALASTVGSVAVDRRGAGVRPLRSCAQLAGDREPSHVNAIGQPATVLQKTICIRFVF